MPDVAREINENRPTARRYSYHRRSRWFMASARHRYFSLL